MHILKGTKEWFISSFIVIAPIVFGGSYIYTLVNDYLFESSKTITSNRILKTAELMEGSEKIHTPEINLVAKNSEVAKPKNISNKILNVIEGDIADQIKEFEETIITKYKKEPKVSKAETKRRIKTLEERLLKPVVDKMKVVEGKKYSNLELASMFNFAFPDLSTQAITKILDETPIADMDGLKSYLAEISEKKKVENSSRTRIVDGDNEIQEDSVGVRVSATSRTKKNDDTELMAALEESDEVISNSVWKVVRREMDKKTSRRVVVAAAKKPRKEFRRRTEGKSNEALAMTNFAKIKIELREARFGAGLGNKIRKFTLSPEYNPFRQNHSNENGDVEIVEQLSTGIGIMRSSLHAKGYVRIKSDLVVEEGDFGFSIPALRVDEFEKFMSKHKLQGLGGHVLLDLGRAVKDAELDIAYEAKFFLDQNLEITDGERFRYIFYVGVEPGNSLLKIRMSKGDIAEKIVHVSESEILFDTAFTNKPVMHSFSLYEKNLLGRVKSELDIRSGAISYFNRKNKSIKKGLNFYQINHPMTLLGMRNYYRFNHQSFGVFVGHNQAKEIEVPNEEFMSFIMRRNNLNDLKGKCLVQVNISKSLLSLNIDGETFKGPMSIHRTFLNQDGSFGEEFSGSTNKVFLVGDYQGIISASLEYQDGSKDLLQTYCSDDTYLVEQL